MFIFPQGPQWQYSCHPSTPTAQRRAWTALGPNESGTDLEHPVSYDCKPMLHQLPNGPPCPQGILTAICLTHPRIGGCT